ncbi:MAG: AraC family transcriptional regulator [Rhodobacteraceae bacterium]|nr:AraC family transcriptional regulator [Paracoccaceae bacterium]MBR9821007.1 AraC family transcriptional regulator [Paracoccaceae bacterium]
MDPLSEVLSLLKMRSYVSSGFDAGGDWSLRFQLQSDIIKCYAVEDGACWLAVDGVEAPVWLEKGDCFVLPSGRPFRLTSDLRLPPMDSRQVFPPAQPGGVVQLNGGGALFLVGSRFTVSGGHAPALLRMMPAIVHVRKTSDQAAIRWSVERMREELRDSRPGGELIARHLAHMMLVQTLRLHLDEGDLEPGWFAALTDPRLGAAIRAMHEAPARRWTLQSLASEAGMSRTVFAQRFRETAGETPMDYLTRWRMLLACESLDAERQPVSTVSRALGYESESAFSSAFKRVIGCTPGKYARTSRGDSAARA